MKKAFFLVLLVPILTIGLISCDASIRSNIADFMGGFSGNVYVEAGLVEPNKADVEAAVAAIATIGTGTGASAVSAGSLNSELGVAVTVPTGVTKILAPQTAAEQETLKTDLAATLNSPTQTATLLVELAKPITDATQKAAAQGTVKVFNAILTALQTSLSGADAELKTAIDKLELPEIDDPSTLTQGDVLVLQMMTNLISNTVTKLTEIGGEADGLAGVTTDKLETNKTELLGIVDDALFTAQIAEQISGAASIDFSGQLDLASLLDSLNDDSSSSIKSRADDNTIDLGDASEFLATINGIVPDILELMGVTKSDNDFVYDIAKYKSFILNQKAYRSAMEHGMIFKRKGGIAKTDLVNANLDTSTLIKYALAVFVTEHDAYVKYKNPSELAGNDFIEDFLNDNLDLGNGALTETSTLNEPNLVSDFYDEWETFLTTRTEQYYRNIVSTLLEINKSGGIAQLTTELQDFRDNTNINDEGGLAGWYAGLIL